MASIAGESPRRRRADLSSGIRPFPPLLGAQKGLGRQAETTLRIAVCTLRPVTRTIPFATEHTNVGLSSQAGFALSGEPIFFARPKKTGEKKRRSAT